MIMKNCLLFSLSARFLARLFGSSFVSYHLSLYIFWSDIVRVVRTGRLLSRPGHQRPSMGSLSGWLIACPLLFIAAQAALAQDARSGTEFFLLSDASFGSSDIATVRVEAQDVNAVAQYGGVDVYVYRVKQPLAFLQAQKNLHRIDVNAKYAGAGLGNALGAAWDNWWLDSRMAWRKLFTNQARLAVTKQVPQVQTHPLILKTTPLPQNPLYKPLAGHTLLESFRYPLQFAKPVDPGKDIKLEGSSSNFLAAVQGNILIPLGKREPGLYLVEAMVGAHRAVTLVFVSDTIAVTKVSGQQMLVWLADRRSGKPVAGAKTLWTDGVGVLGSGDSDAIGVASFRHEAPEKTYVFGQDPQGGVVVSENFYYDSEIYNAKLYAVTDRPLYRPGDTVFIKFLGRNFTSARASSALPAGEIKLQAFDAGGFPVANQTLQFNGQSGGDTSFRLPHNAGAGGYELRFAFQGNAYGAAFRVAEYQKPHFEINVVPDQRDYKTGQEVKGRLSLTYPDGKPVANARVEMQLRGQRLSMIEGDLSYGGQFPLQLKSEQLTTDSKGSASFVLPAAQDPSRYVMTLLATDGAAYRVRASKEILIERGAATWQLKGARAFSAAGESVNFQYRLQAGQGGVPADAANADPRAGVPVSWEWLRLEDRKKDSGKLDAVISAQTAAPAGRVAPPAQAGQMAISPSASQGAATLALRFAEPGTYTLNLRDAAGNIVGACAHYVSGGSVRAPQGSIEMVFDKTQYTPGETAHALVTFAQPVDEALLTLERDQVEKTGLLSSSANWVRAKRLSPTQWALDLPVQEGYGPNITLSLAYVRGSDYVFQNLGLKVVQPKIEVALLPDKTVYAPGEKVTLNLNAQLQGKAAAGAQLTISVVDEMIYVLQPEIAPDLFDFFYHPRRNNVRTTGSLSFIAWDLARPPTRTGLPGRGQTPERAMKVLERPRRDDKDTALWQPAVVVDANGRATVSFIMPESLTRWRVTVRASNLDGTVGQNTAWLRSDKPFYMKWTSPNWMRASDSPLAAVALFNQGNSEVTLDFSAQSVTPASTGSVANAGNGAGGGTTSSPTPASGSNARGEAEAGTIRFRESVKLKPGINFVKLPLKAAPAGPGTPGNQGVQGDILLDLALAQNGKRVDALRVPLAVQPLAWQSQRSQSVPLGGKETPVTLPPDAGNLRLQLGDSASSQMRRVMDDLIDYPYGCVEQTASRLIPYSLALQSIGPGDERLAHSLAQNLHAYRLRLAQMAGPNAVFGWWSVPQKEGDALLTTYAYYADWHASRALKLTLPPEHFERLLELYSAQGIKSSPWQRALMLYWMQEIGLPVRSLLQALTDELAGAGKPAGSAAAAGPSANGSANSSANAATNATTNSAANASGNANANSSASPASLAFDMEEGALQQAMSLVLAHTSLRMAGGAPGGNVAPQLEVAISRLQQANQPLTDALLLLAGKRNVQDAAGILERVRGEAATIDRALSLQWTYRALGGGALRPALAKLVPEGAWQVQESSTGQPQFRWPVARPLPATIRLAQEPGAGVSAMLRYDSREPEASSLPVHLQRRLYRLVAQAGKAANADAPVPASSTFTLELLKPDAVLKTDEVYLDEIELRSNAKSPLRFGLLEVPLPPGMSADPTTWGIRLQLPGVSESVPLERARFEVTPHGYAVPLEELSGTVLVRHLLRAGQTGKFMLPPARYYRMYQPGQKAIEEKARAQFEIR